MLVFPLQIRVPRETDRVKELLSLQKAVQVGIGKCRVATKELRGRSLSVASHHGFENLQPFMDLFELQNKRAFGQAKESVGSLTGSSLGKVVGREAAGAATQQGAFLSEFAERRRQFDTGQFLRLLQTALNSPAGGIQNVYQPGLLDSLSEGTASLAQGGAFNALLGAA